jgi:hypothetical protein
MITKNRCLYAAGVLVVVLAALPSAADEGRGTEMFKVLSPGVLESFKEVSSSSEALESQTRPTKDMLSRQMQTYKETGCLGSPDADPGCLEQFERIRENYAQFLDEMSDTLPALSDKIGRTASRFEQNIQTAARKRSTEELWQTINGSPRGKPTVAVGPLSRRLQSMYEALAYGPVGGGSLLMKGLGIYQDLKVSSEIIELLSTSIEYQQALLQLPTEALIEYSPDFAETLGMVQSEIFGEQNDWFSRDEVFPGPEQEPEIQW